MNREIRETCGHCGGNGSDPNAGTIAEARRCHKCHGTGFIVFDIPVERPAWNFAMPPHVARGYRSELSVEVQQRLREIDRWERFERQERAHFERLKRKYEGTPAQS